MDAYLTVSSVEIAGDASAVMVLEAVEGKSTAQLVKEP